FIAGCIGAAIYQFRGKAGNAAGNAVGVGAVRNGRVKLGVAYGTEKKRWLEWAVGEFGGKREGADVTIELIPMGSLDGAHAILNGDQRIQVWSPASALYKDSFVQDWQIKYNGNPILREERLGLTPMVFVFWDERYQEFVRKYGKVSLATIADAEQQKS